MPYEKEHYELPEIVERRLQVIQDTLEQIRLKKFTVHPSLFASLFFEEDIGELPREETYELSSLLEARPLDSCRVCALGALFISRVRKENEFRMMWLYKSHATSIDIEDGEQYLNALFAQTQLELIENAFELGNGFHGLGQFDDGVRQEHLRRMSADTKAAIWFGLGYSEPEQRMLAILENMQQNRGVFTPPAAADDAALLHRLQDFFSVFEEEEEEEDENLET